MTIKRTSKLLIKNENKRKVLNMKKEQIRKIREEGMKKPGKMMEDMKTNSRLLFEKGRTNQPSNIM